MTAIVPLSTSISKCPTASETAKNTSQPRTVGKSLIATVAAGAKMID